LRPYPCLPTSEAPARGKLVESSRGRLGRSKKVKAQGDELQGACVVPSHEPRLGLGLRVG